MNINIVLVLLNIILVGVTIVYVFITNKIFQANKAAVDAMREQTESLYRPYISIAHFLDEEGLIHLAIKNTGKMNAEKLMLTFDKDYHQIGNAEYKFSNMPLFNREIEGFPPDSEILLALSPSFGEKKDEEKMPRVFTINAKYSFKGKVISENTTIDLKVYEKTFLNIGSTELQLRKINKTLNEFIGIVAKYLAK